MATLALATSFLADYGRLENRLQRRLRDLVTKFAEMTPAQLGKQKGINLEAYNGSADPRSRTVRITDNHRGIVLDVGDGEHFVLTRICTHDAAERWMANNRFSVNAATNALELVDLTAIEEQPPSCRSRPTRPATSCSVTGVSATSSALASPSRWCRR